MSPTEDEQTKQKKRYHGKPIIVVEDPPGPIKWSDDMDLISGGDPNSELNIFMREKRLERMRQSDKLDV